MQFITEGSLCTTQSAVKQVGIDGVALTYVLPSFLDVGTTN